MKAKTNIWRIAPEIPNAVLWVYIICTMSYCKKNAQQAMPLARNALKIKGESLKKCQEMLYNIKQRGIIQKWNKVELRFLCTELPVIARNIHAKF